MNRSEFLTKLRTELGPVVTDRWMQLESFLTAALPNTVNVPCISKLTPGTAGGIADAMAVAGNNVVGLTIGKESVQVGLYPIQSFDAVSVENQLGKFRIELRSGVSHWTFEAAGRYEENEDARSFLHQLNSSRA